MTRIQTYTHKVSLSEIRSAMESFLFAKINDTKETLETLTRRGLEYSGSALPDRSHTDGYRSPAREVPSGSSAHESVGGPDGYYYTNRYSVVYKLKGHYKHLGCSTYAQAQAALNMVADHADRTPMGIYDDRTELFEWDAALRDEYEKASMKDQGRKGEEIVGIVQAMRRRDSSWDSREFRRPSFFA